MNKDAVISSCGQYRYLLQRSWDVQREAVCFIMLNPSTADAETDDPTVRKCIGFAQRLGFGQLEIVNLFACRATDPKKIRSFANPVGPENDFAIQEAVRVCHMTICAWGGGSPIQWRAPHVRNLLKKEGIKPMALRITKDGNPGHPLYIPYTAQPVPLP